MRLFQAFVAAVALASAVSIAPAALAQRGQSSAVVVVNTGRIIQTSDVGRDMTSKLQAILQQMQQEIAPEVQAIQAEEQSLGTATRNMTPEQVRANASLTGRINALQQREQTLQQRADTMRNDYSYTQQATFQAFSQQINPIVQEVMQARGAGVAIDAQSVLNALPAFDATDDVIARLNQRIRTMTVTRQSAPVQAPTSVAPAAAPAPAGRH